MAHQFPTFAADANIWREASWVAVLPPDVVTVASLIMRKPTVFTIPAALDLESGVVVELWFPPLTDVRGFKGIPVHDFIEFPAGSGRVYRAIYVDDYAKGFPNEFRVAFCIPYQMPEPLP